MSEEGHPVVKFTINLSKPTVEWLEQLGQKTGLSPRAAAREVIELMRDPKRTNLFEKPAP